LEDEHMNLDVTFWGENGPPVVMVHGSLNDGLSAYQAQQPLAARWRLIVPNRRGYGKNPPVDKVRPDLDAADIVELLGAGAHLVGTSMGAVVAARAAALAPNKVFSLTLVEPPAFPNAMHVPRVAQSAAALRRHWASAINAEPGEFVKGFLQAMEMQMVLPSPLPPGLVHASGNLKTEAPWETGIPADALATAPFPKLVVSGDCSPVFEIIADTIATTLKAKRQVFPGAGHAVQRIGEPFNALLEEFMQAAKPPGKPA
jgi:pimeloyl-ACP methyl ester carboxylesterase